MAETLTYVDRWSEKWPTEFEQLDEEEARRRHESGELYTVLLGGVESPSAYLEIRLEVGYVAVCFLDGDGRNYLTYVFGGESNDTLFLQLVSRREYDENGQIREGESHHFKPDGTVYLERKNYATREAWEGKRQADVSGNLEPVPEFGRYESIARLER